MCASMFVLMQFRNRAEGDDRDSYGNSWQGESKLDVEAYLSTLLWNVQVQFTR